MNEQDKYTLFELKQKFLSAVPHPKLIAKAMVQAQVKAGVEVKDVKDDTPTVAIINALDLRQFLDENITNLLLIKGKIALANDYHALAIALQSLYANHLHLIHKLNAYVPHALDFSTEAIKMAVPIDAYQVLKIIQQRNLKDDEIKNYLCANINHGDSDELVEIFLRANKIAHHA